MNKLVILSTLGITAVIFLAAIILTSQNSSSKPMTTNNTPIPIPTGISIGKPPETTFDSSKEYLATLETTEGQITIKLNAKITPITANNFATLAKSNFFNNTIFHRVINGFMIQGGDPKGNGTGGPGYKFNDEPFTGEYLRGTVAMANSGPNTNGSQFFITLAPLAELDGSRTIFGQVLEGLEAASLWGARDPLADLLTPPPAVLDEVVIEVP